MHYFDKRTHSQNVWRTFLIYIFNGCVYIYVTTKSNLTVLVKDTQIQWNNIRRYYIQNGTEICYARQYCECFYVIVCARTACLLLLCSSPRSVPGAVLFAVFRIRFSVFYIYPKVYVPSGVRIINEGIRMAQCTQNISLSWFFTHFSILFISFSE